MNNELTDIKNPTLGSSGEYSAVTRNYFTTSIVVDTDDEETLLEIRTDEDSGRVMIGGGGVDTLTNLKDTDIPLVSDPSLQEDGVVLGWNRTSARWMPKKFGETYGPGQNLFVYSEEECDVGGMWTDSKVNQNTPSYYIRVK